MKSMNQLMNQSRKFSKEKGRQSEKVKEAAPYKPQLRKYSQSNEDDVACQGNGKKLVENSKYSMNSTLFRDLLFQTSLSACMKITTAGDLFTARARGWVFFSRASHSFSRTAPALARCQILGKNEEKKSKQTNNQQQKQRKRKTSVDRLHGWQFQQFFHLFFYLREKALSTASEQIERP